MVRYIVLYCIVMYNNIDNTLVKKDCEYNKEFTNKKDAIKFCDELKLRIGIHPFDQVSNIRVYELKDTLK